MTEKRTWSIDSLVLIFSIILVAQLLTYLVPQGAYERQPYPENPAREMVVAGSYAAVAEMEQVQLWPWHFLLAIPKGLEAAQDIIFLIFLVGGVIAILRKSGAIDAALHGAVARLGKSPWILIAGCLLLFSIGAYTIGMGEEYVRFALENPAHYRLMYGKEALTRDEVPELRESAIGLFEQLVGVIKAHQRNGGIKR